MNGYKICVHQLAIYIFTLLKHRENGINHVHDCVSLKHQDWLLRGYNAAAAAAIGVIDIIHLVKSARKLSV